MALSNTPPIGTFPDDDRAKNQRRARRLLARMERMEDHAQKAAGEVPMPEPNLSERDIVYYQGMYHVTYRRLVGVEPQQRALLRDQLREVETTGARSIEEVIESVRASLDTGRILEHPGNTVA